MHSRNLVKGMLQFIAKLTRIELKYNMVARFAKLPAAIPWTTKNSTSGHVMTIWNFRKKKVNKETNFMMQRPFHLIKFLSSNLQAPYSLCQLCFNIYKWSTFNAGANWIAWTQLYPSEVCPCFHGSAWCNKTKMLKDTSYVNSFLTHISNSLLNSGNSLKCSFWFQCSDTKLEITLLL